MLLITPEDIAPFATIDAAKLSAMIEDAEAMAGSVAPCLINLESPLSDLQRAAAKAILRRAILRWHEVGTGVVTQQSAGPFQQSLDTTRSAPRSLFWPSEVAELQGICKAATDAPKGGQVFTINASGSAGWVQSPLCDLNFGGSTCSCGSYLNRNRGPIPEYGELYP